MPITENAEHTLRQRYYRRNADGEVIENEKELWNRVAKTVAAVEPDFDRECHYALEFYRLLDNQDFLPNTPTIMNAGKEKGQLSACYVLPIPDTMTGIFKTLHDAAIIHQTGGGTGFDFSRLRPEGAMVSDKAGVSTGPLAFCQVYDKATDVVKQGASRRGANMMNLRVDHPDILKFIDMKMTPGVMTNFNVSVTVTDEFMQALSNDTEYSLRHPYVGECGKLRAREVWDKIASNAWKSAEPGIIFIDRVNARSPYEERIEATNPCGEQPLPPYGSCNLGSINLANFVWDGELDWDRLGAVVQLSTRFLDNVIDANVYPLAELDAHAKKYRNIGLGVMGWADALIKLKIGYNTHEAVELGKRVMKYINCVAHTYSIELAKEKGLPSGAPFDVFFDYSHGNRRNATLTTVAPTGSLCILANCSSGIEPNFAFALEKHILDTILVEYHPLFNKAKNNGGVDPSIFVEAHSVSPKWHILTQAAFQEHCDSGISKTINLPKEATKEDVQDAYRLAWETGCKGVTVYRDGSREGVLHKKQEKAPELKSEVINEVIACCLAPNVVNEGGCETCKNCGTSKCLIA